MRKNYFFDNSISSQVFICTNSTDLNNLCEKSENNTFY